MLNFLVIYEILKPKHILCLIHFFSENHAFYETLWQNMVEPDRPHDNMLWLMRFACCIAKATDTHSGYLVLLAALF